MVRIAVASSGLGHVTRGIEAWAADLAAELHRRGRPVRLYKGAGTADAGYETVVGCRTRESAAAARLSRLFPRPLAWRLGVGSPHAVEQTTFALNLVPHLRRQGAAVVHVQDPLVALVCERARRLRLSPARVILAHGTEEPAAFLGRFPFVQHLAPWHAEQVAAAGFDRPGWATIPNFIDPDLFHPGDAADVRAELGIPENAVVALTAAAIKRGHKRIDALIDEFARVLAADPGLPAYLVVAGGWEGETDELVKLGTDRLGDRVRFLVRYPRARMPALYRAADVFVLASLFEMMPIALLEAIGSGLPCVTHAHPVMAWMTGPGGVAADLAAPGALAAALGAVLADGPRRRSLGEAARGHAVANFGRAAVVDAVEAYYARVAGPPAGG